MVNPRVYHVGHTLPIRPIINQWSIHRPQSPPLARQAPTAFTSDHLPLAFGGHELHAPAVQSFSFAPRTHMG